MDLTRIQRQLRSAPWKWTLLAAVIALATSWLALLPARRAEPPAVVPEPPPTAAPAAAAAPTAPPSAAATPTGAEPSLAAVHEELWRRTSAENSGDRIEALRALRDAGAVELLPRLLAFDLASDPEVAPTLISVATDLAGSADAAQRSATALQLSSWLAREQARDGRDARGNTASLVEALGRIQSPEATRALAEALDGQHLPLHLETEAVQALARSTEPEPARAAVERFAARVRAAPADDDFQRELQREAVTAAERALAHWQG